MNELLNYIAAYKGFYGKYPTSIKLPEGSTVKPGKLYLMEPIRLLPELKATFVSPTAVVSADEPFFITLYDLLEPR